MQEPARESDKAARNRTERKGIVKNGTGSGDNWVLNGENAGTESDSATRQNCVRETFASESNGNGATPETAVTSRTQATDGKSPQSGSNGKATESPKLDTPLELVPELSETDEKNGGHGGDQRAGERTAVPKLRVAIPRAEGAEHRTAKPEPVVDVFRNRVLAQVCAPPVL